MVGEISKQWSTCELCGFVLNQKNLGQNDGKFCESKLEKKPIDKMAQTKLPSRSQLPKGQANGTHFTSLAGPKPKKKMHMIELLGLVATAEYEHHWGAFLAHTIFCKIEPTDHSVVRFWSQLFTSSPLLCNSLTTFFRKRPALPKSESKSTTEMKKQTSTNVTRGKGTW